MIFQGMRLNYKYVMSSDIHLVNKLILHLVILDRFEFFDMSQELGLCIRNRVVLVMISWGLIF